MTLAKEVPGLRDREGLGRWETMAMCPCARDPVMDLHVQELWLQNPHEELLNHSFG